jgi:hypothetical protein
MSDLMSLIAMWGRPKKKTSDPLPEVTDPEVIASEDRLRRQLAMGTKTNLTGGRVGSARMTMPTLVGVR